MAVYRVWAQCISDVYVDIKADSEDQAREYARNIDGGDYIEDGMGDWIMGSAVEVEDVEPMFDATMEDE